MLVLMGTEGKTYSLACIGAFVRFQLVHIPWKNLLEHHLWWA